MIASSGFLSNIRSRCFPLHKELGCPRQRHQRGVGFGGTNLGVTKQGLLFCSPNPGLSLCNADMLMTR
jgi:hypothetical protein